MIPLVPAHKIVHVRFRSDLVDWPQGGALRVLRSALSDLGVVQIYSSGLRPQILRFVFELLVFGGLGSEHIH